MLGKKAEEMYQFPSVGAHQLQRLESTCEVEKVKGTKALSNKPNQELKLRVILT